MLVVSWVIWNERNAQTFRHEARTATQIIAAVAEQVRELVGAGFACLTAVLRELD